MIKRSLLSILSLAAGSIAVPLANRALAPLTLEAEDGTLAGPTVLTELTGFSGMCTSCFPISHHALINKIGSGYVGVFEQATDKVTFTIDSDSSTLYDVVIRYAGIYGAKTASLVVNGGASSDVSLAETESWEEASAGQVLLDTGSNTLDIVGTWGW